MHNPVYLVYRSNGTVQCYSCKDWKIANESKDTETTKTMNSGVEY